MWPASLSIGVGAGKFLGCEKFLPKFPQTCPKKTLKKMTSKKQIKITNDCISFHVSRIFSNQSPSSTIFAQIFPKLAQISPYLSEKN